MAEMTPQERIDTAIKLEPVDRVPVVPMMDFFCARYKGVVLEDFINDGDMARDLMDEIFFEFGPWDATFQSTALNEFAFALTLPIRLKVPGRELPSDTIWQFDEVPLMTEEDYDFLIENGWHAFWGMMFPRMRPYQDPAQVPQLLEDWTNQAVRDTLKWEDKGVLSFTGVAITPPFDALSMARSLNEFIYDLYRHPDKVIAAMDAMLPDLIQSVIGGQKGIQQATRWGYRTAFLGSTRQSATFISPKMFEKFGLPYLHRIVEAYLEAGITPLFHFDSDWTPLLEYFKEFPRGTCILELDGTTDIFKAKEVLRDHMCLMGDVPAALLKLGTPEEVSDYVKKLIDVVGEGGGFILSTGCDTPVDAKPENVRAMVETALTYQNNR